MKPIRKWGRKNNGLIGFLTTVITTADDEREKKVFIFLNFYITFHIQSNNKLS